MKDDNDSPTSEKGVKKGQLYALRSILLGTPKMGCNNF